MAEDAAVRVEYLALGHEADVFAVFNHREIPRPGVVERLHYIIHALPHLDAGCRRCHKCAHAHTPVQLGAEHDVAYVVEQHHAHQLAALVDYRE